MKQRKLPQTPFGAATEHYRKKERHLSQKRFSEKIGISQAMISKIESGKSAGKKETQDKILKYFGKNYTEFCEKGEELLYGKKISPFHVDYFISMLYSCIQKDWTGEKYELFAQEAQVPRMEIDLILNRQVPIYEVDAIKISKACGFSYEEFIEKGAELEATANDSYIDPKTGSEDLYPHSGLSDDDNENESAYNQFSKDLIKESMKEAISEAMPQLSVAAAESQKTKNSPVSFEEQKNSRHHNVIDEFENHELATEINEVLVRIEKKNPKALKKMLKLAKLELEELEDPESQELSQEAAQKKAANDLDQ